MKYLLTKCVVAPFLIILLVWVAAGCSQDKTAPIITITGNNPVLHCVDIPYEDEGATAIDDEDGDLTNKIQTSLDVNTEAPGTYYVTYSVKDRAGNIAEAKRVVNVVYCK